MTLENAGGEGKNEKLLKHMARVEFKSFHITHPQ
jgi:hypothetical protein